MYFLTLIYITAAVFLVTMSSCKQNSASSGGGEKKTSTSSGKNQTPNSTVNNQTPNSKVNSQTPNALGNNPDPATTSSAKTTQCSHKSDGVLRVCSEYYDYSSESVSVVKPACIEAGGEFKYEGCPKLNSVGGCIRYALSIPILQNVYYSPNSNADDVKTKCVGPGETYVAP